MIRFSLDNPMIVNFVAIGIIVVGALAMRWMPQELFPDIDQDTISVQTTYEGASPVEVEQQITIPIEDALDVIAGIDYSTSTSARGSSVIRYKLLEGADPAEMLREMRAKIDAIENFPDRADAPTAKQDVFFFPVISVAISGAIPRDALITLANSLRQSLLQLPGVSSVSISGKRDREVWIEVDPYVLAARGVTLQEVRDAVRTNVRDIPAGTIRSAEGDVLLRGLSSNRLEDLGEIAVRVNPRGGLLLLREVATISEQLEEAESLGRYNGEPSINLTVIKSPDVSTASVRDATREVVEDFVVPREVSLKLFNDWAEPIEIRLDTVRASGLLALILLLAALYFLLNFRVAVIAAIGIPVALMCGVLAMAVFGQTINVVSTFAFLVVLGIVVDDSIIISENIYRHLEHGHDPHTAAYLGATEMLWPLLVSLATTIAAFLPIFAIGGVAGEFSKVIPIVVIGALIGSAIEAFLILP